MFGASNIVLVTNLCNRFGVDTSELRNCKKKAKIQKSLSWSFKSGKQEEQLTLLTAMAGSIIFLYFIYYINQLTSSPSKS